MPLSRTAAGEPVSGPWFTARRDGWCCECDDRIRVGDTICSDGELGYLCQDCGSFAKERER